MSQSEAAPVTCSNREALRESLNKSSSAVVPDKHVPAAARPKEKSNERTGDPKHSSVLAGTEDTRESLGKEVRGDISGEGQRIPKAVPKATGAEERKGEIAVDASGNKSKEGKGDPKSDQAPIDAKGGPVGAENGNEGKKGKASPTKAVMDCGVESISEAVEALAKASDAGAKDPPGGKKNAGNEKSEKLDGSNHVGTKESNAKISANTKGESHATGGSNKLEASGKDMNTKPDTVAGLKTTKSGGNGPPANQVTGSDSKPEEVALEKPTQQSEQPNGNGESEAKSSSEGSPPHEAAKAQKQKQKQPETPKRPRIIIPKPPREEDEAVTPVTTHVAAMLSTLEGKGVPVVDLMQEMISSGKKPAARVRGSQGNDSVHAKKRQQQSPLISLASPLITSGSTGEKRRRKKIARKLFGSREMAMAQKRARGMEEAASANTTSRMQTLPAATSTHRAESRAAPSLTRRGSAQAIWSGPPDEKIEGGWPPGWTKKIFRRMNGATKGSTDRYWYTPVTQRKLRSMKEVARFMGHLRDNGGDEQAAW
eukprot:CAMPEP_0194036044 /NCGR_PEP_ID=MMETSP0009_2-20130614/8436_1 /TAXON_ID=210454 /ORGANISM="Grammatophora oceanica, Strain CCMP 410" /LENGTH=539 /DNA_ID=CAMNT_0038677639 /DNA_START=225 /DNA_END=1841 /DNA_ORIENTATION=-